MTPSNRAARLTAAAERGYADAQCTLGALYCNGGADVELGAEWFKRASDQGHADAEFVMGCLYRAGLGVPRNVGAAKIMLHRAASKGHADALAELSSVKFE